MQRQADIIIPIYNAYDDLKKCLESLYINTNLTENRLILIDDNSPDDRIYAYLEKQREVSGNIIVIHNDRNQGFSANINRGMACSAKNDAILLNSDTILTRGWVEKLKACAYSNPSIGTVTPLSNNASLCSVPNFCEENELPDGLELAETADVVERHSLKKYPQISVANGFCMYVKREVIDAIGTFDAETFGRGYGEENDFCNRAAQLGYIHVMCDDTYIYHSGTKSFVSKEKEEYIRQHDVILRKRYPVQMQQNDAYVNNNPNHIINDNYKMWFNICDKKKNILYMLHSDFRTECSDNVGGVQFHVRGLVNEFRDEVNVFVLARDNYFLQLTIYIEDKEYLFRYYVGDNERFPVFSSRAAREIISKILITFEIDLVHVHHTAGISMDIFGLCREYKIPVFFTVHDYYSICPNEKLLDETWKLCDGNTDEHNCRKCLSVQKDISEQVDFISVWRAKWRENFQICEKIFVPSESAGNVINNIYPDMAYKISVIEHGVEYRETDYTEIIRDVIETAFELHLIGKKKHRFYYEIEGTIVMPPELMEKERLRVVLRVGREGKYYFIPTNFHSTLINSGNEYNRGCFSCYIPSDFEPEILQDIHIFVCQNSKWYTNSGCVIKLEEAKRAEKKNLRVAFVGGLNRAKGAEIVSKIIKGRPSDVEWIILGGLGNARLEDTKQDNLLKTGYYNPEDLTILLRLYKIDVVCIFSVWAETYSYTLSETVMQGIPVVVSDIGALGERGKRLQGVTVLSLDNLQSGLYDLLDKWNDNLSLLAGQRELINSNRFPTIAQMADGYRHIYKAARQVDHQEHRDQIDNEFVISASISGNGQISAAELEKMASLEQELNRIYNSISYRLITKLLKIRIPFREELKRLLKNVGR